MINFISDICSNHNGDLTRCINLIDKSKEIGCWGIKLQLFKAEKLFANIPLNSQKIEIAKQRELPIEWIPEIERYCEAIDIKFGCTPFDIDSLNLITPHIDFIKISSFDILRDDFIKECAKANKSLILSTGLATMEEIDHAREIIRTIRYPWVKSDYGLSLLHCISKYPTKITECNLKMIPLLKTRFDLDIGWSDHSRSEAVIYQAIIEGGKIIEFHLDLDGNGWEYQHGHCWLSNEIKKIINNINLGEIASEFNNFTWDKLRLNRADPSDGLRPMMEARR